MSSDDGLDINNGKAVSGRVAFSPMLGVEVAGSSYYGNNLSTSYNPLSITALDWTLQQGPFESSAKPHGPIPEETRVLFQETRVPPGFTPGSVLTGIRGNSGPGIPAATDGLLYPGQLSFHAGVLDKISPRRFGEGSTFTAVSGMTGSTPIWIIEWDRWLWQSGTISFGLNYRPIEDAVFKMSYQYQPMAFNPNTGQRIHDSALVISAATYF